MCSGDIFLLYVGSPKFPTHTDAPQWRTHLKLRVELNHVLAIPATVGRILDKLIILCA